MKISNKNAFTLIELLVVVVIIAILAAIAFPQYQKAIEKSRWSEGMLYINALSDAWERHLLATGTYTENMSDLDITIAPSKYFNTPAFHNSPLPHIQSSRVGNSALYVTRYATTKMTYCTAQNGNAAANKFCAELTGQTGVPCPEPGWTCYTIK